MIHTRWIYRKNGDLWKVVTTYPSGAVHTRWV